MNHSFLESALILVLLLLPSAFAMTEIVSSRRGILQAMAEKGSRGAAQALELADNPNRFLSTVQIGITLVGILAGAFGGARLVIALSSKGRPGRPFSDGLKGRRWRSKNIFSPPQPTPTFNCPTSATAISSKAPWTVPSSGFGGFPNQDRPTRLQSAAS